MTNWWFMYLYFVSVSQFNGVDSVCLFCMSLTFPTRNAHFMSLLRVDIVHQQFDIHAEKLCMKNEHDIPMLK